MQGRQAGDLCVRWTRGMSGVEVARGWALDTRERSWRKRHQREWSDLGRKFLDFSRTQLRRGCIPL